MFNNLENTQYSSHSYSNNSRFRFHSDFKLFIFLFFCSITYVFGMLLGQSINLSLEGKSVGNHLFTQL